MTHVSATSLALDVPNQWYEYITGILACNMSLQIVPFQRTPTDEDLIPVNYYWNRGQPVTSLENKNLDCTCIILCQYVLFVLDDGLDSFRHHTHKESATELLMLKLSYPKLDLRSRLAASMQNHDLSTRLSTYKYEEDSRGLLASVA